MFRSRVVLAVVLAVLTAVPSIVSAQQARIQVSIAGQPDCLPTYEQNTLVVATVTVVSSFPFQTLRFKAPPECGLPVVDVTSPYPFTGDVMTGVEITLPACTNAPVDVMTITAFAPNTYYDCIWNVAPADGDADIVLTDCDGFTMKGARTRTMVCDFNTYIAPYRPDPPDGATDVPVNTMLSFIGDSNEMYLHAGSPDQLQNYPVCSFSGGTVCSNPFNPGMLQPHTTYYWRAGNWCVGCDHGEGALSDTWSFTTGDGPVATEQTTWGHVKALYR